MVNGLINKYTFSGHSVSCGGGGSVIALLLHKFWWWLWW